MSTTFSDKSWNSSDEFDDDNSSTTNSSVNRRISGDLDLPGGVITTHCVSSVIRPGRKQSRDPLQFVKIQSTELSKKAVEQIRMAEEVKVTKEKIKEVEEEWQSNLLNWKSKRRQGSGSELGPRFNQLNDDPEDREKKTKTFSEILHEKKKSGHRIGYNLHLYVGEAEEEASGIGQNVHNKEDSASSESSSNPTPTNPHHLHDPVTTTSSSSGVTDDESLTGRDSEDSRSKLPTPDSGANSSPPPTSNASHHPIHLLPEEDEDEVTLKEVDNPSVKSSGKDMSENQKNVWNYLLTQQQEGHPNKIVHELEEEEDDLMNESTETEESDVQRMEQLTNFRAKLSAFENLSKEPPKATVEPAMTRTKSTPHIRCTKESNENVKMSSSTSSSNLMSSSTPLHRDLNLDQVHITSSSEASSPLRGFNQLDISSKQEDVSVHDTQLVNSDKITCHPKVPPTALSNIGSGSSSEDVFLPDKDLEAAVKVDSTNESGVTNTLIQSVQEVTNVIPGSLMGAASSTILDTPPVKPPHVHHLMPLTSVDLDNEVGAITAHLTIPNGHTQVAQNKMAPTVPSYMHHPVPPLHSVLSRPPPPKPPVSSATNNYYENTSQFAHHPDPYSYYVLEEGASFVVQEPLYSNQQPLYMNSTQTNVHPQQQPHPVPGSVPNRMMHQVPPAPSHPQSHPVHHHHHPQSQVPFVPHTNYLYCPKPYAGSSIQSKPKSVPAPVYQPQSQPQHHHQVVPPTSCHLPPPVTGSTSVGYNKNHWLIQEAELRRQIAASNKPMAHQGSSSATSIPLSRPSMGKSTSCIVPSTQVVLNDMIHNPMPVEGNIYENFTQSIPSSQPLTVTSASTSTSTSTSTASKPNVLSVSGRKKCSSCGDELGRGCAAMVIESLSLYYHITCFRCSVCHIQLGNGTCGTDVRVRNHKLHCNNCYSNDEAGLKFSRV